MRTDRAVEVGCESDLLDPGLEQQVPEEGVGIADAHCLDHIDVRCKAGAPARHSHH